MFAEIKISEIIQILGILGFGGAIFMTMRNNLETLKRDVVDLKVDIKIMNGILIKMAVTDTRLSNVESDIRELRHGQGYIVNGEYTRGKITE